MHCGLVYPSLPPVRDGGADYVDRLASKLVERGVRVTVIADSGEVDGRATRPYDIRAVSDLCRPWTSARIDSERRDLDRIGVDVLQVVYPTPRFPDSYVYPGVASRLGRPVVGTVWGLNLGARSVSWRTKRDAVRFFASADVLTTHDPEYLAMLRAIRGWSGKPTALVPVGYNLAGDGQHATPGDVRARLGWHSPTLVYFGGLDPSRGFEDLLRAIQTLGPARGVRLVVIGGAQRKSPYYERMHGLASSLGISKYIEWTDYLPASDVEDRLLAAAAVVLPFTRNSVGRSSLAAAFAIGVPVVIAANRWARGVLEDAVNCLVVPRRRPDAIVRAVERLLLDVRLARSLSDGARESARQFTWDAIADRTLAAYHRALGTRVAPSSVG